MKNQSAKPEERAVARKRIDMILHYWKEEAAFSKLAECTSSHLKAYQRGMTIAFDRYHDGFIELPALDALFSALEKPYDYTAFVSARIGWWRKLVDLWERHQPEDERSLIALSGLGGLYRAQGQYAKAEPLYERALAIWEKALGPEHPDVATALNNLAGLYGAQGQYAKAEPLYGRALAIWEKALGPEHPNMAASLNNLAGLYHAQGQYAKAEPLYGRALAIWEKALGPEHPNVAASLNNLGWLYKAQGQYAKAEPLYQRALAISKRPSGRSTPTWRQPWKTTRPYCGIQVVRRKQHR